MKFNKEEVCILIPTLNEGPTIGGVVREFKALGYNHILVMDGRSTDNTVKVAREAGANVRTQSGKGKGNAIIEAFEVIEQPYILMLDGDGTYSARDAEKMLTPLFLGFDQVIGDRLINAEEGAFSRMNLFGNHMLNMLFKIAHSRDLHDILSGYRAFTKLAIHQMHLKEKGFEIETEISVEAVRNGHRIMVVPVKYSRRPGTATKLSPFHDGMKIVSTIYRLARVNNPMFYFGMMGLFTTLLGLLTGLYVLLEWLQPGHIEHIPLTILTVLLIVVGIEIFMFGVISDMLLVFHREIIREIQLLQPPKPPK
ncbi:S-layer glycoprotein N-glycosyltransferase AglJ [Methanoregula formicica]|uniref:Glycosyl transferase n=1 Tax=Methanoregula formicica (strain DSM 22288 / NBRC 105244 / SMSP) TaxID=593750 RepID=L0HED3_METFS|nr:S-layer glycoprotein N-glycosyltransferase AglJ [Methanoregula formicica]AGB02375.1 glycosyl transferase [Methanoregula formicica SMSP]